MELYHVSGREYKIGDIINKIEISKFLNREIEGVFTKDEYNEIISQQYKNGFSNHGFKFNIPEYEFQQRYFIDNNIPLEIIYEQIRKQNYADKPSRFESIFTCDSIENAKLFLKSYPEKKIKIYKIQAERFFKADMKLLSVGFRPIDIFILAHKYWQGKSSDDPFWEYIVELPVKIIEECNQ